MLSLILPIWMLAVAIGGFVRVVAPHRYVPAAAAPAAGKTSEADAPLTVPAAADLRSRLAKTRISGLVRLVFGSAMIWMMGLSLSFSPAPVSAESGDQLDRLVREKCARFLKKRDTAGLAVAIISGAQEKVFHFGRSALGTSQPVTEETLFEIGSITKAFTGIALARHVEDGRLNLEDKIAAHLPPGLEVNESAKEITFRHLTTHTSGYSRMPGSPQWLHLANFLIFGGDPYRGLSLENFSRKIRTAKPETPPGEKMSYSNFAVSLLGWLLAQKAGLDYDALIRKEVLDPLGMNATSVVLPAERAAKLAQGYRAVNRAGRIAIGMRSAEWLLPDHLAAAGGLRATGRDMLKFLRANLRPDDSPIGRALKRSHGELFKASDTGSVGMNWLRSRREKDSPTVIWHNGGTGGFRSYLGFLEDGSAGVVILSNATADTDHLGADLLKAIAALPK